MVWFGLVWFGWFGLVGLTRAVVLLYDTLRLSLVQMSLNVVKKYTVRNSNNILLRSSLRDLLRSTSYSGCVERSPDKMIRMTPR